MLKKLKFFPSLTFSEDLVWSAFYSKTRVFTTFLKRGWLGFAHIRSTCGPDLPRASHALRMDAHFRQGLPRKKVRCAYGFHCILKILLNFQITSSGSHAPEDRSTHSLKLMY